MTNCEFEVFDFLNTTGKDKKRKNERTPATAVFSASRFPRFSVFFFSPCQARHSPTAPTRKNYASERLRQSQKPIPRLQIITDASTTYHIRKTLLPNSLENKIEKAISAVGQLQIIRCQSQTTNRSPTNHKLPATSCKVAAA